MLTNNILGVNEMRKELRNKVERLVHFNHFAEKTCNRFIQTNNKKYTKKDFFKYRLKGVEI